MPRRWLDRVLVAAAVLLVAGVAVDSLASRGHRAPALRAAPTTTSAPEPFITQNLSIEALAPQQSRSRETRFRMLCAFSRLTFDVRPGPVAHLDYLGPPCRLPRFAIQAAVRDPEGHFVRRVPALVPGTFVARLGGDSSLEAPLAPGLLRCRSGRPPDLGPADGGKLVRGTIRCRAQR